MATEPDRPTERRMEHPQQSNSFDQPPVNMTDPSFNRTHADATKQGDNHPPSLPNAEIERGLRDVLGPDVHQAYTNYADGMAAFTEIDSDRNGFISREELTGYINARSERRESLSEEEQRRLKAAENLLENINTIQSASNDEWGPERSGITRADLEQNLIQRAMAGQIEIMNNLRRRTGPQYYMSNDGLHSAADTSSGVSGTRYPHFMFPFFNVNIYDPSRAAIVNVGNSRQDITAYPRIMVTNLARPS